MEQLKYISQPNVPQGIVKFFKEIIDINSFQLLWHQSVIRGTYDVCKNYIKLQFTGKQNNQIQTTFQKIAIHGIKKKYIIAQPTNKSYRQSPPN